MKKVVIRQTKGRREWEIERDSEIKTHNVCISVDRIELPFSKYRVTEIPWKQNDSNLKACSQIVKYILIKMGKHETSLIWNIIVLFPKLGTILDSSIKKSRLSICGLNRETDCCFWCGKIVTHHKKQTKDIADVRIPECTLGSNCTNKQADPGAHFLKRYMSWLIKEKKT